MTASEIAAWWGAAIATAVLGWDIYKWARSGPRLTVKALPNMQLLEDRTEAKNILVEVVNRGNQLTTLTHLAFYNYKSIFHRMFRRRNAGVGLVPQPGGQGLPFELEPGKRWVGLVVQNKVFEFHDTGLVFAAIVHSGSNKDSLCQVQRQK